MTKLSINSSFATLFKKYRLRSEIETLAQFGDLLAEEGMIYESSLFTKWQKGERIPHDRKTSIAILKVFSKRGGIKTIEEANNFLDANNQGYLTESEQQNLPILQTEVDSKVLQASLGGLLKDYRRQKNVSELEVCLSLGWKDTTRLKNIEQGLEKPTREIMDDICRALNLKEQEKNYLLLIGNYLPTKQEVESVRLRVKNTVHDWPFPAVLLDFTWRILDENVHHEKIFHFFDNTRTRMKIDLPRVIEMVFHPDFISNKYFRNTELEEWKRWQVGLLIHFRAAHQNRTKENWYVELISKMMDNSLFKSLWTQSNINMDIIVTKHGMKKFINPDDTNKRLQYSFFLVPLINDPRFDVEFFLPMDIDTFGYYQ